MKPIIYPQDDGSLRCANCGAMQFQPKRSTGRKVGLGLLSLATQPNELRCIACGARYSVRRPQMPATVPARPD